MPALTRRTEPRSWPSARIVPASKDWSGRRAPTFLPLLSLCKDHATRADWDRALTADVAAYEPDLVISAGFMKLVGPEFLARFEGRMINTHPALLPSFPGIHGPRDALAYGVKITGATVFLVDAGIDSGVILDQRAVPVADDDTVETLHERIKVAERETARRHHPSTRHPELASRRPEGALDMTDSPNGDDGSRRPIKRALVSVYDKTDLLVVAQALVEAGAEIISTGSTAEMIAEAGLPVTAIEKVTGFPECLDGRVKTLHPMVHAGLLADLRLESHRTQIAELGIEPFDLLISNLYPFTATVASGATPEACIEQIDIGGPAMVRSSAKNHASVAVITSPEQYPQLLEALAAGGFTLSERQALAAAAFVHTATYDVAVASWMGSVVSDLSEGTGFPRWMGGTWEKVTGLRYGENPHQPAALYRTSGAARGLASARATARQGDVLQQLRRCRCRPPVRRRLRRARRRDHQTREPMRHCSRIRHRRGPSKGPCLRSDVGVRRRDRR